MKHALVNKDNKVVNIIMWDGRQWTPPKDMIVIQCEECGIGDTYNPNTNKFDKPMEAIDPIDVKPE